MSEERRFVYEKRVGNLVQRWEAPSVGELAQLINATEEHHALIRGSGAADIAVLGARVDAVEAGRK